MKIIAYLYSDPLLQPPPDAAIWGWEVDRIYQDFDRQQPQLQVLLQDCQAHPADYLLLRQLAELGQSVQEVSDRLAMFQALGIQVIATEQEYRSNIAAENPAAALKLLAEIQRQHRNHRIRRGHAANRLKALPPPGKAPYGYRRGKDRYVLDRSAAPVVKDFFEHFLLYGSLRGAVRYLEKKYGKKISVSTGRRWLTNPVYRGDLAYDDQQVLSGTHMPILSREEAAQVDRLLRRNRSLAPRTASAPRSLAGLVACAACHSPMSITRVTRPRQQREYLYLRPTACPQTPQCRAIAYQQVLDQTISKICRDLPQAVAEMNPREPWDGSREAAPQTGWGMKDSLTAAIATKQQALNQLPGLVESEVLDSETAALRAYKLRSEISELQKKIAQLPPVNLQEIAQAVSIPQFWLDLSESERRFYFREFILRIEIVRQEQAWSLNLIFVF